jgi:hypothetical protein
LALLIRINPLTKKKSKLAANTDLLQPTVAINLQKIETYAVSASDSEFNWKNIMTKS